MRVTSKGQVTIPLNIRRGLGIKAGSEVEFVLRDDEAVLRPATPNPETNEREVAEFMAHIRKHRGTMDLGGLTPDEFMALLRD
jgi:AbrB family looped-hinge helix DNA binding protein